MELTIEDIKKLIPQRYPFIMIDRILHIEPGKEALAVKNVTVNELFFAGHFPGNPIMPGALIIEAIAQTAIVLFATKNESVGEGIYPIYFFGSCKARFLHPVIPGDQLKIKVVNVKSMATGAYVSAEASVGDKRVAEADLVFSAKNE
jgi:3-hydroxyacyl-[acyl-carrier-protein] dehydratase